MITPMIAIGLNVLIAIILHCLFYDPDLDIKINGSSIVVPAIDKNSATAIISPTSLKTAVMFFISLNISMLFL